MSSLPSSCQVLFSLHLPRTVLMVQHGGGAWFPFHNWPPTHLDIYRALGKMKCLEGGVWHRDLFVAGKSRYLKNAVAMSNDRFGEFEGFKYLWRMYSNLNQHYRLVDDQRWGQTPSRFLVECRNPWWDFYNCSFVCLNEIAMSFFAWDQGSWRGFSSKLVETLSTLEFLREPTS